MADSTIERDRTGRGERPTGRSAGLPEKLPLVPLLKLAVHVPDAAWRPLARWASAFAVWKGYRPVRQWRMNAEVVMGRPPTDPEARAAVFSWFRNLIGSVQLGKHSPAQLVARVQIDPVDADLLKQAHAGPGAVVALPHMGDWDLCGAWATALGLPVSSVAERLADEEFEYFMGVRAKAGLRIYSHKDRTSLLHLENDLRQHRVVALVADRDLSRAGIPVQWQTATGPRQVTMPRGPAFLAQTTGASLLVAISDYQGDRMRLRFFGPIQVDPGEEGIVTTTQRLADIFSAEVMANPIDWHLMQRFFPGVRA